MIYVFDTCSLRVFNSYYPERFPSIWEHLQEAVDSAALLSVKEVKRELSGLGAKPWLAEWAKRNGAIFHPPTEEEATFIGEMFKVAHYRRLIGQRQALSGQPVADPYLIAAARCNGYTVVSEEEAKPNSAKIPVVCKQHNVNCINLDTFMGEMGWSF
jgi:hypothetical protein